MHTHAVGNKQQLRPAVVHLPGVHIFIGYPTPWLHTVTLLLPLLCRSGADGG